MKKLLPVILFFAAVILFVLGYSSQLMPALFLAFWVYTLIYIYSKKNITRFSKRALGALISIIFALVAYIIGNYLHPNTNIDFLLLCLVFTGCGWFFEYLS
jgi:hypothetical protein